MNSSISEFGHIHGCKYGLQSKTKSRKANSVEPDDTAHYDLHCLRRYLY